MKRLLILLIAAAAVSAAQNPPPNILFVFSDDHSIQTIGAYESRLQNFIQEHRVTPNLDRLADEGAVFPRSYCCNSLCGPSRAAVLTGKHSSQNGYLVNQHGNPFDGSQWTFPKVLQQHGYQTALIGKWHLQSEPTGFDSWEILPGQGDYYNPVFIRNGKRLKEEGYVTDLITKKAIQWLEQRDPNKPFLMMCQQKAPHRPWMPSAHYMNFLRGVQVPEPDTLFDDYSGRASAASGQRMEIGRDMKLGPDLKVFPQCLLEMSSLPGEFARMTVQQKQVWDTAYDPENKAFFANEPVGEALTRWKYQRYMRDYLRCVKSVDDSVGQLLDWLDRNGLAGNTVVIYSSDQGFYMGEHGWFDKRWIYEESLRMPFLIRWPAVIKPGSIFSEMIQNIDYAPTFLDMAGLAAPPEVQGRSILPVLRGEHPADWRSAVYYHYYEFPGPHRVEPHRGLRTERYTLADYYRIGEWELFDNRADPQQLHNVYADPEYAPVVQTLQAELATMEKKFDPAPEPGVGNGSYTVSGGTLQQTAEEVRLTGSPLGYAIQPVPEQFQSARQLVFKTTVDTAKQGLSNGLLCFGDTSDPETMIKCGVYSGKSEMVVLYGEFGGPEKDIIRKPAALGKNRVYELTVSVNLDQQIVQMDVDGQSIIAPLRAPMPHVRFYGFNCNRTTTGFSSPKITAGL